LIFDRLKAQMQSRNIIKQPMLLPFDMHVNAFEAAVIREKMPEINAIGFDIEERGETVFSVTAIPMDLQNINLTAFFNEVLGDVGGYRAIRLTDILKDKLATAACKAAVKGGMDLTREEIDALFALMDGDMGLKCPHGRPVVVKMSRTEIEKMFKRIV
jgi:DNA mismatch repair protein MutL